MKMRKKSKYTRVIARTIFYQLLALFIGVSLGFLVRPEYWGNRAPVIEQSVKNIFFPIEYNEKVEAFLIDVGRARLHYEILARFNNDIPKLCEIVKDSEYIQDEERYHCEFQYLDSNGEIQIEKFITRIKWKPWEWYYPSVEDAEPESF
jgi:hypothetical protein